MKNNLTCLLVIALASVFVAGCNFNGNAGGITGWIDRSRMT
jgi:predicted small secreted protein